MKHQLANPYSSKIPIILDFGHQGVVKALEATIY